MKLADLKGLTLATLLLTSAAASAVSAAANDGEGLRILGSTGKPAVLHEPGEPMVFTIRAQRDGKPATGTRLAWTRTGDDGLVKKGEALAADEPLVVTTSIASPGFVRVRVVALDDAGRPLLRADGKTEIVFDGGAGAHPAQLASTPEPSDLDAWWTKQKAALAEVPLKVLASTPLPSRMPRVETFDLRIASPGGAPVSGYYSKPRDLAPRSAGARIHFHGHGVRSAIRRDELAADAGRPMLVLDINAHGIENGRPPEFYAQLARTELQGYGFKQQDNERPETVYFLGMVLRALRALEFLKAQPEWDGRTLIVVGGSQGAFQALLAAALDPDVSQCIAAKPWLCDLAGPTLGRLKGWRPEYTPALGYFDPVHHARRIRCETSLSIGLGDYVCPPSGVTVLFNNIPDDVPKRLEYRQGETHGHTPPNAESHVISNTAGAR